MKKKPSSQPSPANSEKQPAMIIQDIYSRSGKPLIAVVGKRSKKKNAHLKDLSELMIKRLENSASRDKDSSNNDKN